MIKQEIINRKVHRYDNGTMGFSDYETKHEDFKLFVDRVSECANNIAGEILSISYPNSETAVIAYRENE